MFKPVFRSIFSKLVAMFAAILIICFSLTGIMLYFFLGDFASDEKAERLRLAGEDVERFLRVYIENEQSPLAKLYLSEVLEVSGRNSGSIIFVTNKDGYVVAFGPNINSIPAAVLNSMRDESGYYRLPDLKQHQKIISGREIVKGIGDFSGLFKNTGYLWLTVAKPFKYSPEGYSEEISGVIYLHTPLPEIQKTRLSLFRLFLISIAVSVLISVVLVYVFSLKMTSPLKQINNAAKVIASGEFNKRLDIKSRDEIGELAKSFNQMALALQNIEEMRRGFIANVSHELRTPMTSIRGFIEGILDGTIPPDKHKEYLSIVRDEANRLNRLVNDLLDLARMEAGETSLALRKFDINELIRICIIKFESMIIRKNIRVEAEFEEEKMLVNADPDAIERVLNNLVHNAIKFTSEGGRIAVSASWYKDKALVSVKDNGAGINEDEIDRIWDRFYKSDKSRGKDKTGAGLGLAIVKSIIKEHGQEIWVESKPGAGAKFTFTLDRA